MKKVVFLFIIISLLFCSSGCGKKAKETVQNTPNTPKIKVGFIFGGNEKDQETYLHYQGALQMQQALSLTDSQIVIKWNIPEDEKCYDAAVQLADLGCDIIFADRYGHGEFILLAAEEYPDVQFCHATGDLAAKSGMRNVHNFNASVYEARYVSGIVAGLKLNEMIEQGKISTTHAKMGFVGAFSYPEVVSGYTAFFLGARSVCESVTMEVKYTGAWMDEKIEKQAAEELSQRGCVLISHHTDSLGVAKGCETAGIPIVGNNISLIDTAPNLALTSVSIDWTPYLTFAVKSVLEGTEIPVDWCKGYSDGVVRLTPLNEAIIAPGTKEAVLEAEEAIKAGSLPIFDTSKFTVYGSHVTTTASQEWDYLYHGVEYIQEGVFQESTLISAPTFAFRIDGIFELNVAYE